MKNLGLKEQIFIAVAIAVLAIVVCGVFIWKPQFDRISTANQQIETEKSNLVQKQNELESLKLAKKDAPKIEAQSLELNKEMPEEEDIASLVVEMEQAATESSVKILNIDFTEPKIVQKYSTIDFSGEIQGSYFNLADFLYQVSQMPRQVKIRKLVFEYSDQGYPLLSVKADFTTYVYATDVAVTTTAAGSTNQQTTSSTTENASQNTSNTTNKTENNTSTTENTGGTNTQ